MGLKKFLYILDDQLVIAADLRLAEGLTGSKRIGAQRVRILVDIDSYVDYAVHSDLHLHAVAAHGFIFLFPVCKVNPRFANWEVTSYCLDS